MGIFYLDRDSFGEQLKLLVSAGDSFDRAKNNFYESVKESSEIWSDLSELGQFGSPLRDSVVGINDRLVQISSRYRGIVSDLQQALLDFDGIDEEERKNYVKELNGLTDKFTYNPAK